MDPQTSVTQFRERLPAIIDSVLETGETCTITRHGRPVAVVIAHDEYESLVETLNILSDDRAVAQIVEAERETAEGQTVQLADLLAGSELQSGE